MTQTGGPPALVDTHTHLDFSQFDADREQVTRRARQARVVRMVNVGADLASSRRSLALAEAHDFIYASVGVHPHDARTVDDAALAQLAEMAGHPRVVAVGEIGLDYYRDLSPRPQQAKAFAQQLELAHQMNKPVIIHTRDAHEETWEMLQGWAAKRPQPVGVMHCYSGSLDMARQWVALGFMIGIDGPITFRNAHKLPEIVAWLPLDHLLLETDCPYLTPHPHRGKRNEPAYLPLIAQRIAEIKGIPLEQVAEATTQNARQLFGLEA